MGPFSSFDAFHVESIHTSVYCKEAIYFAFYLGRSCAKSAVVPQNSAYGELSKALHITIQEASYCLTVAIITSGVFPLIWSPLSNIYGRRPIFVFVSILGIIGHCASGAAKSWAGILVARAFMGIGTSAGSGIGFAVVADMYFMHERGR